MIPVAEVWAEGRYEEARMPPEVAWAKGEALAACSPLRKAMGLGRVRCRFAKTSKELGAATYISGSAPDPIILLDGYEHVRAAGLRGLPPYLEDLFEASIAHEFGHAYLEHCGLDCCDHDEDVVERAARLWCDCHDPAEIVSMLDDELEQFGLRPGEAA